MWRVITEIVFPLLLPALLYVGWIHVSQRLRPQDGEDQADAWQDGPWLWLALVGIALAAAVAFASAMFSGDTSRGRYVPPQWDGTHIVPGHVEPRR